MRKSAVFASLFLLAGTLVHAQDKLDIDMIEKIKTEGTKNSRVMDIAFHLTDANEIEEHNV